MQLIFTKPIDPDMTSAGSIEYNANDNTLSSVSGINGIFATAYYFRDTDCTTCNDFKGQDSPWVKTDVYKLGILHYLRLTELPTFSGWKVVIYLDRHSLENPIFKTNADSERTRKHIMEWEIIAAHPNAIFAVVDWPEYAVGSKGDNKTIDNAIMRALRLKALHDFPNFPVFIRDADTLFENLIKAGEGTTTLANFTQSLADWENTLWNSLKDLFKYPNPYRLLVATQPNYYRQWHVHPDTGKRTTGCYAAVTSTLGNIPEFMDGSLWKKCLAYLRKHMQIIQNGSDRTPSNISKPTYIGKDEQLLSFVVIPAIFEKIYFYYLEYIRIEGGFVKEGEATPFARMLLQKGITTYPSPYRELRNNEVPVETKEANQLTETTILNPKSIELALSTKNHELMKSIFQFYLSDSPDRVTTQSGGRRGRSRDTARRRRRRARRRSYTSRR
jgi:hypothetical protein